jgi:hypothetical protein
MKEAAKALPKNDDSAYFLISPKAISYPIGKDKASSFA